MTSPVTSCSINVKISTPVDMVLNHNLWICATFYILLLSANVLINKNGENEEPNEFVCGVTYWSLDQYWGQDQYQFSNITNCNDDLSFPDRLWRTACQSQLKNIAFCGDTDGLIPVEGEQLSIRMVTSAQAQLENTVPPCPQGLCISRWSTLQSPVLIKQFNSQIFSFKHLSTNYCGT